MKSESTSGQTAERFKKNKGAPAPGGFTGTCSTGGRIVFDVARRPCWMRTERCTRRTPLRSEDSRAVSYCGLNRHGTRTRLRWSCARGGGGVFFECGPCFLHVFCSPPAVVCDPYACPYAYASRPLHTRTYIEVRCKVLSILMRITTPVLLKLLLSDSKFPVMCHGHWAFFTFTWRWSLAKATAPGKFALRGSPYTIHDTRNDSRKAIHSFIRY